MSETQYKNLLNDEDLNEETFNLSKITKEIKAQKLKEVKLDEEKISSKNFILTKEARERLQKCYNYIQNGVPILLEGPTGTSKTLTAEVICEEIYGENQLIKLNLSSETKIIDLLGKPGGDSNSWSGISLKDGPFLEAFQKGKPILLDEINLASTSVLQCIEEALDSGILSTETPGMPLKKIKMKKGFTLIATQNPNKGLYSNKRQELGIKFLSKFQVITFPSFNEDELKNIALGLSEKFGFTKNEKVIKDLVRFHMEWSSKKELQNEIQCFTIREIAATIKAFSDGQNQFDAIMTIYGARYQKSLREQLKKTLLKYDSFKNQNETYFEKPKDFPIECFWNHELSQAMKSIDFSIKNNRPIIIAGPEGCGKTQLSRWISKYYGKEENENDFMFCICTEDIKCSDIIGKQKPNHNAGIGKEIIQWKDGILVEGIKNGKIVILDSIEEAPATITERINCLLDQKYDGKERKFEVHENPEKSEKEIIIHKNFRLICTCDISKIDQISPAFINRFDVIVLENQLTNLDEKNFKELIKLLLKSHFYQNNGVQISSVNKENKREETEKDENHLQEEREEKEEAQKYNKNDEELGLSISLQGVEEIDFFSKVKKNEELLSEEKCNDLSYYKPDEEIVNLIYKKGKPETIYKLSQLCRAALIYSFFFKEEIPKEQIVNFTFDMILKDDDLLIPENIEEFLLQKLPEEPKSGDFQFFYRRSKTLKNFIARLYASSLINLHLCILGPPGIGKTAGARSFSRIRANMDEYQFRIPFLMHSFHSATKPSHFYGTTTIKNGKVSFLNGSLTNAMTEGITFIADELNLSSTSNMKSLAPALEQIFLKNIFIPGIDEKISIQPSFFFIVCQNEFGTIGRNAIPFSIAKRLKQFNYPKQEKNDLVSICVQIKKSILQENFVSDEEANNLGNFMYDFNNLDQKIISLWSFRDIYKIFQRILYQNETQNNFYNIQIYHNILFYILSGITKEEKEEIIKKLICLIKKNFNLKEEEDLEAVCFNILKPKKIDDHVYIMKGSCGINEKLFQAKFNLKTSTITLINQLPSFYETYFNILLSSKQEPILLAGPSGYKQFLAENILESGKVVSLNQESSIEQLLGFSVFLTEAESKRFYVSQICEILGRKKYDILKKLETNSLKKEEIDEMIESYKPNINYQFLPILKRFSEKIFSSSQQSNSSVLKDTVLEFKPGLFLSAILSGKSLILKNLSNLPTIVLERFNELFSLNHNLTLNEDIHNTFSTEKTKEFSDLSANFRIFGTCGQGYTSKLSEAVLSRFTVISVDSYQEEEKKFVLKNFQSKNLNSISKKNIEYLLDFNKKFHEKFRRELSLLQMINSLLICNRMNENQKIQFSKDNYNLEYTLFITIKGLLESKSEIPIKILKELFDQKFTEIHDNSPIEVKNIKNSKGIFSNFSKLFFNTPFANIPKTKLAFPDFFIEMIEVLHFGLTLNIPVVLEGFSGQGKQTAIQYIADSMGYKIINIAISKLTKVDELFSKPIIKKNEKNQNGIQIVYHQTKLLKILKQEHKEEKVIVVFHNINNASPAVLEILSSIFDIHNSTLLLPDGQDIQKGNIKIIGIFNSHETNSSREKLPNVLIHSSIYHIVKHISSKEIQKIIQYRIQNSEKLCKTNQSKFFDSFIFMKSELDKIDKGRSLTLNDISKFIKLREVSFDFLDEEIILQIMFGFRSTNKQTTQKFMSFLGNSKVRHEPIFKYKIPTNELIIELANRTFKVQTFKDKIDQKEVKELIRTLTTPQKTCLLFLFCCFLARRPCIIQGKTASGKSHVIRVFSKMMGMEDKLNIYQMNNETGISILTGQGILKNKISEKEGEEIKNIISEISNLGISEINKKLDENFKNKDAWKSSLDWEPKNFYEMFELIDQYLLKENHESSTITEKIKVMRNELKYLLSPASRFEKEESKFIRSIKEGEWVVIDGIESASSEIGERISSLVGENPELDLFESEGDYHFTKEGSEDSMKINENFYLFITYNPISQLENKKLPQTLIDRCITFILPSMDSSIEYSTQILFGNMINSEYKMQTSIEIASRMANIHQFCKELSQKEKEKFSGELQFTGRTLKFVSKELNQKEKEKEKKKEKLAEKIFNSLQNYYWNSYSDFENVKEFYDETLKSFENCQPGAYINLNEMSKIERNSKVLNILKKIQECCLGKVNKVNFIIKNFVNNVMNIEIDQIEYISYHIQGTLQMIEKYFSFSDSQNEIRDIYYQIIIVKNILKELQIKIPKEQQFEILKDENLLTFPGVNHCLSKLYFFMEENDIFSKVLFDSLFLYDEVQRLIYLTDSFFETPNLKSFINLLNHLKTNKKLFYYIEILLPSYKYLNQKERESKLGYYWITLFIKLNKKQTKFNIRFDQQEKVDFDGNDEFSYVFQFSSEAGFNLSKGSKIIYQDKIFCEIKEENIQQNSVLTFVIYHVAESLQKLEKVTEKDIQKKIEEIRKRINDYAKKKNQSISYQEIKKEFSIFGFFSKKDNIPFILAIWIICLIGNEMMNKFCMKYLISFQKELFQTVFELNQKIQTSNFNIIKNFTKSMIFYLDKYSVLLEIKTGKINKNFIESLDNQKVKFYLNKVNTEISQLKNINKGFWSAEDDIKKLETILELIKEKRLSDQIGKEQQEKIKKIKDQIENYKFNNKKSHISKIKKKVINAIEKLASQSIPKKSEEEHNKKIVDFCQKLADKFFLYVNKDKTKSFLNWPFYESKFKPKDPLKNEDIKIINLLLKYSQIYSIINKIQNKEGDIFEHYCQLCKFNEMENVCQILIDFIEASQVISVPDEELKTNLDVKEILSTLNGWFLSEYYNNNIKKVKITELYDYVNEFIKREKTESFLIEWISKEAKKYQENFEIYLPNFTPNDFLYLFINFRDPQFKVVVPNFLLENYSSQEIFTKISKLRIIFRETAFKNTFSDALTKISNTIYSSYFDDDLSNTAFEDIIVKIQQKLKINQKNEKLEIIKKMKKIIDFLTIFNEYKNEGTLKYPDIDFLKEEVFSNSNICKYYPSLIFYFSKNYEFYQELKKKFFNFKPEKLKNSIPLWIFTLRITSSFEYVNFEMKVLTKTIPKFQNKISTILIKAIQEKTLTDGKWVNLFLSNIHSDIEEPNLRWIYNFINEVYNFKLKLSQKVDNEIEEIIENIIFKIFYLGINSNLIKNVFESNFDSSDSFGEDVLAFFRNPEKYIEKKLKEIHKKKILSVSKSEHFKNLLDFSKIKEVDFQKKKKLFEESIKKIQKEYNQHQKDIDLEKSKIENSKNLKALKKNIKEYNKLSDKAINEEKDLQTIFYEMMKIKEKIPKDYIKHSEDFFYYFKMEFKFFNDKLTINNKKVTFFENNEKINKFDVYDYYSRPITNSQDKTLFFNSKYLRFAKSLKFKINNKDIFTAELPPIDICIFKTDDKKIIEEIEQVHEIKSYNNIIKEKLLNTKGKNHVIVFAQLTFRKESFSKGETTINDNFILAPYGEIEIEFVFEKQKEIFTFENEIEIFF